MRTIKLSVTDLERLWILTANEAEYNSKEGSKKQKIYYELSNKLKKASSNIEEIDKKLNEKEIDKKLNEKVTKTKEDKCSFQDYYDFDRGYLPK